MYYSGLKACVKVYPFNKIVNACLHGKAPTPRSGSAILSDKRIILKYLVKAEHVYPRKIVTAPLAPLSR